MSIITEPTFYTEDLFRDEENDNNLVREFIDIFNNSIYHLYIKIFCKNRMSLQAFELKNEYFLSSALAFGGLADRNIIQKFPKKYNILRYIGVMGHLPRSALGLKIILADMLEITNIEIHQCTITTMQIPIEQQFCLGFGSCALGVDSHLGHEIASGNSGFSVRIGPVSYEEYISLIPGSEKFKIINDIINLYIDQPLTWDVEITVEGDDVEGVCLGSEGANALGYNTWVLADDAPKPSSYKVTFPSP